MPCFLKALFIITLSLCQVSLYAQSAPVDLGLSVKWASCNVGAKSPEEAGHYYQWAQTSTNGWTGKYTKYTPGAYWAYEKDSSGILVTRNNNYQLTRYNWSKDHGKVDNIRRMTDADAHAYSSRTEGGRVPTRDEVQELIDNCRATRTTINGIRGVKFTSRINGNSIFIPYSYFKLGEDIQKDYFSVRWRVCAVLWTSDLSNNTPHKAYSFEIREHDPEARKLYSPESEFGSPINAEARENDRYYGCAIRLVFDGGSSPSSNNSAGKPNVATKPDIIDLGLSINWASFNLGASKPEDYGEFYAWGEVETREYFKRHKWEVEYALNMTGLTKYCTNSKFGLNGFVDNKVRLDPEDDAATVKLGKDWRMPKKAELDELLAKCTWKWGKYHGVNGYFVTSNVPGYTDRSIFLPAGGNIFLDIESSVGKNGYYWTSDLYTESEYTQSGANSLIMKPESKVIGDMYRAYGLTIRPVTAKAAVKQPTNTPKPDKEESAQAAPVTVKEKPVQEESKPKPVPAKEAFVPRTTYEVPEIVDLGLSVKWASFNLGASKPAECGDYFAWGETEQKGSYYSWSTYKLCKYDGGTLTKYCPDPGDGFEGYSDTKSVLDAEDDAAQVRLGDKWRIPMDYECQELMEKCKHEWIEVDGVYGMKFTSKINGNSIFLPAAGVINNRKVASGIGDGGIYSSSSMHRKYGIQKAYSFNFNSNSVSDGHFWRWEGVSIRPVYGDPKPISEVFIEETVTTTSSGMVDLGLSVKWASCNVGAKNPEEFGGFYAWGETEAKGAFSWSNYKWAKVTTKQMLTKYCSNGNYGLNGYSDTKTALDTEDDAARANLGEGWRMPTDQEIKELEEKCTWDWIKLNGVRGFKVTSPKNGNSIFLPAAGCRVNSGAGWFVGECVLIWSSSMDPSLRPGWASCLSKGNDMDSKPYLSREKGCPIRAVHD